MYAFHTSGNASWQEYDWSQITTVCVFGVVDPQMLCKAHSVGARVTLGAGGPPSGSWNDTTAVATWVKAGVARVKAAMADGLNLDVEVGADDPQQVDALTPAVKQMADAMHAAQPGSHVTFDAPSEGETGSTQAKCGKMFTPSPHTHTYTPTHHTTHPHTPLAQFWPFPAAPPALSWSPPTYINTCTCKQHTKTRDAMFIYRRYGRDYDYKGLAEVLDFFVVMDYDSNDAKAAIAKPITFMPVDVGQPRSGVYIYKIRAAAAAACSSTGRRLCQKAELKGFEKCAYGWTSDWNGYWMASAKKGCGGAGYTPSGYVPFAGPSGAYCCGDTPPCPTCFFANAALPVVKNGVECFKELGVQASKLVLAFPWCECSHHSHGLPLAIRHGHVMTRWSVVQTGTITHARAAMSRAPAACVT